MMLARAKVSNAWDTGKWEEADDAARIISTTKARLPDLLSVYSVELMANPYRNEHVDLVVGAESRGFIFGTAIAQALNCGFVPVRKPGKLPAERKTIEYELEYGTDAVEIHADAIAGHHRVLMVDDLLATGGTMRACCDLVHACGGEILGIAVLIELAYLNGRNRFEGMRVESVLRY